MNAAAPCAGPVNIGNAAEFTVLELAECVRRLTGSRSEIVFEPASRDDPRQRCPDITLASALLGWWPRVALEEGLRHTIEYFRGTLAGADRAAARSVHPPAPNARAGQAGR